MNSLGSKSKPALLENYVEVSLVDLVTDQLRHDIYTGKFKPGQRLIVRELSEYLNVSHTPIKDALNRLVAEGYVIAPPRKSMIVREYTNSRFIESMQVRMMIEVTNAQDIVDAVQSNPVGIEEMRTCLHKQAELGAKSEVDFEKWLKTGELFHNMYLRHMKNRQMYEAYMLQDTHRGSYFSLMASTNEPFLRDRVLSDVLEHEAIMQALAQGDVEGFKLATVRHIYKVCAYNLLDKEAEEVYAWFDRYFEAMGMDMEEIQR